MLLFKEPSAGPQGDRFDVSPDGQRFFIRRRATAPNAVLIQGWRR
jgi:hypothetical protein